MRINHRAAPRHVADEQNHKDAKKKKCRAQRSRSEIKPSVSYVNSNAGNKNFPATTVGPLPIDESSEPERKHPSQSPKPAIRIGSKKRD
jgi:hypothetical protein